MQVFNLDLTSKTIIPILHAKQGDVGRKFKAILTDNMVAYAVPAGAVFSVWYSGASGDGNYTDIGGKSAVAVSGNEVTVEMIAQMLINAGHGMVCLAIVTADGDQIGTWNIPYFAEPLPGMGSEQAKTYYTAFSKAIEALYPPDTTLSVAGKAADAAAVGQKLKDVSALPKVTTADNGKILQVVNGGWAVLTAENSVIKTYVEDYLNEALGGDY